VKSGLPDGSYLSTIYSFGKTAAGVATESGVRVMNLHPGGSRWG